MPKLDLSSSHQFWKNYEDPMIYRVIAFMETVEEFRKKYRNFIAYIIHCSKYGDKI